MDQGNTALALAPQRASLRRRAVPASAAAPTVRSGVCHGTLGELLQGPYERGGELHIGLISLPIRRYSWVHFAQGEAGDIDAELTSKPRCRQAIALYLKHYGLRLPPGRWSHDSELPIGKGMASSTADIVATVRCLDQVFARRSPPPLVAALLRQIERSDSVFLDRHALYLSGLQEVVRTFARPLRLHACYIDEGGAVETESAAAPLLAHYRRRQGEYARNLDAMLAAFGQRDPRAICACSTRSAALSQGVLPKPSFAAMQRHRRELGADGIVVAHTGSLIGYLYARRPSAARMSELSAFFHGLGRQCRFVETGP
ncbi:hypothetical protein [Lysobacter silvisoli]|uniref:GHMP kinase N-terminal domain-containing protein n=1 Tax=Lysobacter silvisoli TaxID=2293254 RepID=A0A371JWR0_9GAMM|nr:hypothetical protein [Lysobacter silvisoli]RDZ26092.1 hypothetical protein DX914_19765 [Lysobacter silvisoli]